MKNFSIPEIVSPTVEADEVKRLYESITSVASKQTADNIIEKIPLALNSTPKERAEWVEKLSDLLEEQFDEDAIKQIRQRCYCNENGKLEESANALKDIYISCNRDMQKFVNVLNESGAGWHIEDDFLYTKMFSCPCPMLEEASISNSLTWCHCTAGYTKRFFELAFDMSVEAEIVHSMRQGYDECLVKVSFK